MHVSYNKDGVQLGKHSGMMEVRTRTRTRGEWRLKPAGTFPRTRRSSVEATPICAGTETVPDSVYAGNSDRQRQEQEEAHRTSIVTALSLS
jgi:hypothetical protein